MNDRLKATDHAVRCSTLGADAMKLDEFTTRYVETALWSSTDNSNEQGGDPLDDNYGVEDIDDATLADMVEDCKCFQNDHWDDISDDPSRAGFDFWLTRNGHGAGFWDGDWPEKVGERLTEASKAWGEYDLYVDEGVVYGYPPPKVKP